ncbi:MAG: tRNA pseudouridine(38-40) synthase TruA [Thermoplasmata archaeon]|nr:tRNA pseudouridine(38-40) synthase TruA [Thermoplasmata archaeon]
MRYALKFGYDGTVFQGYARQPGKRTVEEDIIGAMKSLGILKDGDEFRPGSRTDRGVSAAGNVIVIGTDKDSRGIIPGLNSELDDIVFHGIARVDEVFNPRHAVQRWYRYYLLDDGKYNENILLQNSNVFLGEHDFRNLSKTDHRDEVTVLAIDSIDIDKQDGFLIFDIRARRFLWQMIRRLIPLLLEMHDSRLETAEVLSTLSGGGARVNVNPMDPGGLILMDITYKIEFEHVPYTTDELDASIRGSLTRALVLKDIANMVEP